MPDTYYYKLTAHARELAYKTDVFAFAAELANANLLTPNGPFMITIQDGTLTSELDADSNGIQKDPSLADRIDAVATQFPYVETTLEERGLFSARDHGCVRQWFGGREERRQTSRLVPYYQRYDDTTTKAISEFVAARGDEVLSQTIQTEFLGK